MKTLLISMCFALSITIIMFYQNGAFAEKVLGTKTPIAKEEKRIEVKTKEKDIGSLPTPTIQVDKTLLNNGGTITVTGTVPPNNPVYLEIYADQRIRVSRFDADVDKETGKRPYILYMTHDMPAYYKICIPQGKKDDLEKITKRGKNWSYAAALKDLGADLAYDVPARIKIDSYQASLIGSVLGKRGELLSPMDDKENEKRSMQLVKARFRSPDKVFAPIVDVDPTGRYKAVVMIPKNSPSGSYTIVAALDKNSKSQPVTIQNSIRFPTVYLKNAGTSLNIFLPFFLALCITIFGVLMGAGGGFILNPLLVSIWPLPHTVVAGTVMPTVLFSQASGIYNYSKIKFINWKLGISIGVAMVAGAFIGPKLTEMITLDQFKFIFGWILIILALLMFWQTTPGYIAKNKKEQAIIKEFKKKAEEAKYKQG